MEVRPKMKLELTTGDKVFEGVGWLAVLTFWILVIASYSNLAGTLPAQFNGIGAKVHILLLPFIATVLFVGLTILNKYPHIFNYPGAITEENALRKYTNATRMVRYLKLMIIVIFGLIAYLTV
jgi:hypothetical protein